MTLYIEQMLSTEQHLQKTSRDSSRGTFSRASMTTTTRTTAL